MRKILLSLYKKLKSVFSGKGLHKIFPIGMMHAFLIRRLKSDYAEVQGHKMFLDPQDTLDLSLNGIYEPLETELVKREVRTGDIVLDLGANIGYFTLIFAKIVGEEGRVYAFEPDPKNFALLQKNVRANGYNNVTFVQKAVSNTTGSTKLFLCPDASDTRIYDPGDNRPTIEIESVRLDDYFTGGGRKIDFIKMDIQGAEGGALQGMAGLIKENRVKMVTEFWPKGLQGFGIDRDEFMRLLLHYGFKLYQIDDEKNSVDPADIPEIFRKYTVEKGNVHANLFCVKES